MDESKCVICDQPILVGEASSKLTQKGCDGIKKASEARGVDISAVPGQQVHQDCRKTHCNERCIDAYKRKLECVSTLQSQSSHSLRSGKVPFSYNKQCLFCGTNDIYDGRKKEYILIPIRTYDFQEKVREICIKRDDDWAKRVKVRIDCVHDLHAADAVYHQACSVNFRTGKQVPQKFQSNEAVTPKRIKLGRPQDEVQKDAFRKVIKDLEENDEEQTTIHDLIQKMHEYLVDTGIEPYGFTYMKEQIKNQHGKNIIITERNGKPNVVTMWSTARNILHEFYAHPKQESSEIEKMRIIKTAAKLIKNDIKSLTQQKDVYPKRHEMASAEEACSFLPESLTVFLQDLFTSADAKLKIASIGQAVIQATRPRVILSPLQLGLGIQLHHNFASKFLIETLHKLGFCCSYKEVTKFEHSAAATQGTEVPNWKPGGFIQYAADNVDHNACTLDGHNTFHGMGMIAMVTPGVNNSRCIPRVKVSPEDIAAVGRVDIKHFISEFDGLQSKCYVELHMPNVEDPTENADLLWNISWPLRSPRPAWSGFMQMIHKGNHPGQSSVLFLPMIDINPGDLNCLYSTMLFVSSHARRYEVTPILTFDQPLWWKASAIQEGVHGNSEIRSIVLRLGGFHTEMSFLGCIGHIMAGSGLQELLECIYASNTVGHMLSGKAVSRAIRGHLLVSGALNAILMSQIYGIPIPGKPGDQEVDEPSEEASNETAEPTYQHLSQDTTSQSISNMPGIGIP